MITASITLDCDMDIGEPNVVHNSNQPTTVPQSTTNATGDCNSSSAIVPTSQHGDELTNRSKRPRLSIEPTSASNGTTTSPLQPSYAFGSASNAFDINSLKDRIASNFDAKFSDTLRQRLTTFLTQICANERALKPLSDELKLLRERVQVIESSAKELNKLVVERVALPAPTTAVGQKRSLSSQAPRALPPSSVSQTTSGVSNNSPLVQSTPTLAVSAQNLPPIASTTNNSTPLAKPILPNVAFPAACVAVKPSQSPAVIQNRCVVTNGGGVCSVATATLVASAAPVSITGNGGHLHSGRKPSLIAPSTTQLYDTIDLTVDPSPEDTHKPYRQQQHHQRNMPIHSQPVSAPLSQTKPGRPSLHRSLPPPLQSPSSATAGHPSPSPLAMYNNNRALTPAQPRVNIAMPSLTDSMLRRMQTFHELQALPVAPLPPVPAQLTNNLGGPGHPMPRLTIAEAAEGVCLQWTVNERPPPYETVGSYEIYSYASSELTTETIRTCLPWKKVGQVAALPLPMACTLTHVQAINMYYFVVRAVDHFGRYSNWSNIVNAYVG